MLAMAVTIKDNVIGNHIKAARKKSGLTQANVADELDVSISYYSRIECGEVRINLERLLEICVLLKIHPHPHIHSGRSAEPLNSVSAGDE